MDLKESKRLWPLSPGEELLHSIPALQGQEE